MAKKREQERERELPAGRATGTSKSTAKTNAAASAASDRLAELNERARRKGKVADTLRRQMEADLEAKTRQRRREEQPASALLGGNLKRGRG